MSTGDDPAASDSGFDIDELLTRSLSLQVRENFDPEDDPRHAAQRAIADLYYLRGWKVAEQLFIRGAHRRLYFAASCEPARVDEYATDAINVSEGPSSGSIVAGDGRVIVRFNGPSQYFASQWMPAVLRAVTFEPSPELLATRRDEGRRQLERYTRPSLWTLFTERVPERDLEPPEKLRHVATGLTVVKIVARIINHFR